MGATSSAASYRLGSDVVGAGAVVAPGAVPTAGAGVAAVIAGAMKTIAETVPVSDPTGGAVAPPAAAPAAGPGAAAAGPEPPAGATPSVVTTNARGSDSRLLRNCSIWKNLPCTVNASGICCTATGGVARPTVAGTAAVSATGADGDSDIKSTFALSAASLSARMSEGSAGLSGILAEISVSRACFFGRSSAWAFSAAIWVRTVALSCSCFAAVALSAAVADRFGETSRNQPAARMSRTSTAVSAAHCLVFAMSAPRRLGVATGVGVLRDRHGGGEVDDRTGPDGGLGGAGEIRVGVPLLLGQRLQPRGDVVVGERRNGEGDRADARVDAGRLGSGRAGRPGSARRARRRLGSGELG